MDSRITALIHGTGRGRVEAQPLPFRPTRTERLRFASGDEADEDETVLPQHRGTVVEQLSVLTPGEDQGCLVSDPPGGTER